MPTGGESQAEIPLSRFDLLVDVLLSAEEMEGDVGDIADYPAIVAGRAGWDVEERAGAKFVDGAVFHRGGGATGDDEPNVLDVTARRANAGPDVEGPLPTGLIGGATDGHTADANKFKLAFFEDPNFVGFFKTLQNGIKHPSNSWAIRGQRANRKVS
jgi:hypothetical protein